LLINQLQVSTSRWCTVQVLYCIDSSS